MVRKMIFIFFQQKIYKFHSDFTYSYSSSIYLFTVFLLFLALYFNNITINNPTNNKLPKIPIIKVKFSFSY